RRRQFRARNRIHGKIHLSTVYLYGGGCTPDQLSFAALELARARVRLRRYRVGARSIPLRDCRAFSFLFIRRCYVDTLGRIETGAAIAWSLPRNRGYGCEKSPM